MKNIWFVSDMHFGHNNILTYCNRPFTSVEEMDSFLVENWNNVVQPDDDVWHLGDWAFHNYERIGELRGNIRSVPGNHDYERRTKLLPYLPNGFESEIVYLKIDKVTRFVLCHYPIESWRREYKYHLHGHTHGTTGKHRNRLDVGLDATRAYRPISIDEVLERIQEDNAWVEEMQR